MNWWILVRSVDSRNLFLAVGSPVICDPPWCAPVKLPRCWPCPTRVPVPRNRHSLQPNDTRNCPGVCSDISYFSAMNKYDKPWQAMTSHDKAMTSHDKPWQAIQLNMTNRSEAPQMQRPKWSWKGFSFAGQCRKTQIPAASSGGNSSILSKLASQYLFVEHPVVTFVSWCVPTWKAHQVKAQQCWARPN